MRIGRSLSVIATKGICSIKVDSEELGPGGRFFHGLQSVAETGSINPPVSSPKKWFAPLKTPTTSFVAVAKGKCQSTSSKTFQVGVTLSVLQPEQLFLRSFRFPWWIHHLMAGPNSDHLLHQAASPAAKENQAVVESF
jgi:hypothetical protein